MKGVAVMSTSSAPARSGRSVPEASVHRPEPSPESSSPCSGRAPVSRRRRAPPLRRRSRSRYRAAKASSPARQDGRVGADTIRSLLENEVLEPFARPILPADDRLPAIGALSHPRRGRRAPPLQARAARRRVSSAFGGAPTTVSTTWPSLKKSRRGDGLDAVALGQARLLIDVHLGHDQAAGLGTGDLLEDWADRSARPTPGRPEVHQQPRRPGDDLGEVALRQGECRGIESRSSSDHPPGLGRGRNRPISGAAVGTRRRPGRDSAARSGERLGGHVVARPGRRGHPWHTMGPRLERAITWTASGTVALDGRPIRTASG